MTVKGCMNGHEPEFMETRPTGARVCTKCRNHYFSSKVRTNQTRKVNKTHEHRAR